MTRLLREPLVHFLLIGGGLFLLFGWRGGPVPSPGGPAGSPPAQIVVTQADVAQMVEQYEKTWQRPPTEEERKGLVEDFVRSEIYYREAAAIGLDRDDPVLRRRLRQKMEFIFEDISSLVEPTDAELRAFVARNREKYLSERQLAFRQVYVDTTARGARAEADARQMLARLAAGANPDSVGDATMLAPEVPLTPLWEIARQFGDEFAGNLRELAPGTWAGPIRSGFGLHLVLVSRSAGGEERDLQQIREIVKQDWIVERQREVKDAAYAKLRERYSVIVESPSAAAPGIPASSSGGATR
jgi:hypothetical protein